MKAKLERLREKGPAFPNDFRRDATADELHTGYGDRTAEWLDAHPPRVTVAGRMMAKRIMGKASFAKVTDCSGSIQLFLQHAALGEVYEEFKDVRVRSCVHETAEMSDVRIVGLLKEGRRAEVLARQDPLVVVAG